MCDRLITRLVDGIKFAPSLSADDVTPMLSARPTALVAPAGIPGTMTGQMMRAAYVTSFGGAGQIRVGPMPMPSLSDTDVLVRVDAVAVNLADAYVGAAVHP